MAKRRHHTQRGHDNADDDENEWVEEQSGTDEVSQQTAPAEIVGRPEQARTVSHLCGMQTFRGHVDHATPTNQNVALGTLPANAMVFGGGVWVSEPFDAGAVLEVGNETDLNTYISVPLNAAGFTPVNLKPAGAPGVEHVIVGTIQADGALSAGRADFVLMYC